MKHADDVSKAITLLKQTLPEMNKRNVASTPDNYAIWYEYVAGCNSELKSAIDELDANKTLFTPDILKSLYDKYIADAHESAVNKLSESVREIIHEFLLKAQKEGQGLSEYAQTLSSFSKQAEHANDLDAIRDLVQHLIAETKKREDATQQMQTSLENMALEMKKLRTEVAKINSESTTDTLTKVNNRRAFDIEVEALINASKADNKMLCLVIADIDQFDLFNGKFGHGVGDKVLRFVASLIKNNIKGSDSVSRYHGDQFAILLPDTNFEGAQTVAENIRGKLAKQTLSDSAEKKELGTITASFGVTCFQNGDSSESLIRKVEAALAEAKSLGRNKVVGKKLSDDEQPSENRVLL